jgi:hypothetical protein
MIKTGVIIMALFGFLNAGWFSHLFDSTPTPPITVPIDLSKAGSKVEFDVRLPKKYGSYKGRSYYIWLEFIWTDEIKDGLWDAKVARKIAGYHGYYKDGRKVCDKEFALKDLAEGGVFVDKDYSCFGTTVPLHVTIYKVDKKHKQTLIVDKTYQTKGTIGGWRYHMMREVDSYKLKPGKYKVVVVNIDSIVEMKGRKADIRFARSGSK